MTKRLKFQVGCIHCGHPFSKHDTTIIFRSGWRVHPHCLTAVDGEGHQFKGCTVCYLKGKGE